MSEALSISIEFPNEGIECGAYVEPLGDGMFRVLDSLALIEAANYGDTVELRHKVDDRFEFVRLVDSANFRVFEWVLDSTTVASTFKAARAPGSTSRPLLCRPLPSPPRWGSASWWSLSGRSYIGSRDYGGQIAASVR